LRRDSLDVHTVDPRIAGVEAILVQGHDGIGGKAPRHIGQVIRAGDVHAEPLGMVADIGCITGEVPTPGVGIDAVIGGTGRRELA